ncbi:c-type cytochrome [Sulfurirhabdus autotrophica]|uniref:Cytochrome c5 n=1 Tax=Sulfurirhabdus autotrophica TaxID=1706046 RepID=A0A4R3XUB4_9PROT|nr:c-type cytochrome [Sulfurirhabdus autotrophica]TCV83275.1 cytochrome c5 [Sulfurirhabdus autotrophica]
MIKTGNKFIPALVIALALSACGKKEEAQTAAPAQPTAEAAKPAETAAPAEVEKPAEEAKPEEHAADEASIKAEKTFKATCSMCHQTGAAGAPILGNKEDWGPRIAQGMPTLYEHAIKGFTGKKGMMPPKGANASLSDDDVKATVDYMVSKAK